MKINQRLSIVVPIEGANGSLCYIHSTPISDESFHAHGETLGKVWTRMTNGLGLNSGMRLAADILKKVAVADNEWDGPGGVELGVMMEIRRLSSMIAPGGSTYETIPLDSAIQRKLIDKRDQDVLENFLVFFTLNWHMQPSRKTRDQMVEAMVGALELQISSSGIMEFISSLPKLTEAGNTGGTVVGLSAAS